MFSRYFKRSIKYFCNIFGQNIVKTSPLLLGGLKPTFSLYVTKNRIYILRIKVCHILH